MKQILCKSSLLFLLVSLFLSACSTLSPPQPVESTPDVTRTIDAIIATMTASAPTQTLTPFPTATATSTLTPTSSPLILQPLFRDGLLYQFDTTDQVIVLTIDDGYYDITLNTMLDMLEAAQLHATFFLVGNAIENSLNTETLTRLIEDGNDIGYHSNTHADVELYEQMEKWDWQNDYKTWSQRLRNKIGDALYQKGVTNFVRAPYGAFTPTFMDFCHENGLVPVWWNSSQNSVVSDQQPIVRGGILLLHVKSDHIDALQIMIDSDWKIYSLRDIMPSTYPIINIE